MEQARQPIQPAVRPNQEILLEMYPPAPVFALISWGAAATSWLARTLNAHPDIYCVHAANHFWHVLGGAPYLDGVDYIRLIACQGYAHRLAGDIHGVSRQLVPQLREVFGDRFKAAVVVRDPLPRLRSQFALFERYMEHKAYDVTYVGGLIDELKLPVDKGDYVKMLYVHGVNMLNAVIEEKQIAPIFTAESLTSDPAALKRLIFTIGGDDFPVDDAWCRRMVRSPKVNAHQSGDEDMLRQPWLADIIQRVVKPQAWEIYRELGYNVP